MTTSMGTPSSKIYMGGKPITVETGELVLPDIKVNPEDAMDLRAALSTETKCTVRGEVQGASKDPVTFLIEKASIDAKVRHDEEVVRLRQQLRHERGIRWRLAMARRRGRAYGI